MLEDKDVELGFRLQNLLRDESGYKKFFTVVYDEKKEKCCVYSLGSKDEGLTLEFLSMYIDMRLDKGLSYEQIMEVTIPAIGDLVKRKQRHRAQQRREE